MEFRVSFYILKELQTIKDRDLYACRIIEKAYNNKHKVFVFLSDLEETNKFDTQLWTFSDISFVPHEIYNQANDSTQILLGYDHKPNKTNDILINLTSNIPIFYQDFNHIIEVIPNDEQLKKLARVRFKQYKQNGAKIETFDV